MVKKKSTKKARPKHVSRKANVSKKIVPEQKSAAALLPPIDKEVVEDEAKEKKDEFFDEDELKEFSVQDEEEGTDDLNEDAESEPAWDEEEY
jgi:hypothetical protein